MKRAERVAVLGGGIQGICVALELHRRGCAVTLIERDDALFNRASLRSEGKIHLGLVYAADSTRATARRMAEDALEFAVIVDRLTDGGFRNVPLSAPFLYLVPPDSMLTPTELEAHYAATAAIVAERLGADAALHYLGRRPSWVWRPLGPTEQRRHGVPPEFLSVYESEEASVDLSALATVLRYAVTEVEGIEVRLEHRVQAVERQGPGYAVEGDGPGGTWRLEAGQVVNTCWEQRLAIDACLGIPPPHPWVHRLKYRLLVRLPVDLRSRLSATYTLGPYGDVVVYRDGTSYVSWYPTCIQGWSNDLAPPAEWDDACRGVVPADRAATIAADALGALDAWFPGLARSQVLAVDAGAIVAWGESDIVDPESGLHQRAETGVWSSDGYHSIDTGKLTNAPSHAIRAADAVCRV